MDELKVRLAKVSKQLEDMQAAQQSLAAQQATQQAQQQAQASAPPPDVLYNNALRDYNGDKNDLALQEFSDYIKFYPNTDLAGNCYFYLGEIQFKQGNYQAAAQSYDQVLQNFPSGLSRAPVKLTLPDRTQMQLELLGGFLGVAQGVEDNALAPVVSWAVVEKS